jgi:hypothetical protein
MKKVKIWMADVLVAIVLVAGFGFGLMAMGGARLTRGQTAHGAIFVRALGASGRPPLQSHSIGFSAISARMASSIGTS